MFSFTLVDQSDLFEFDKNIFIKHKSAVALGDSTFVFYKLRNQHFGLICRGTHELTDTVKTSFE